MGWREVERRERNKSLLAGVFLLLVWASLLMYLNSLLPACQGTGHDVPRICVD